MIKIDLNARPFITDKVYLKHLADVQVFEKQLDAWAYAAAYAMKHKLPHDFANKQAKSEPVTDLDHLDDITREILSAALEDFRPDLAQADSATAVRELSLLASAGITVIREKTEGRSINEIYEFLLNMM